MSTPIDIAGLYERHGLVSSRATARSTAQAESWIELGRRVQAAAFASVPTEVGPITVVRSHSEHHG